MAGALGRDQFEEHPHGNLVAAFVCGRLSTGGLPPVDVVLWCMATDEEQLTALIEERVRAVRAKDPGPLAARQSDDVLSYGVLPPLRSRGGGEAERATRDWFDLYASDIGYEVREVEVRARGDLGLCSFVYHVSGTLVSGAEVSMWVRATLGCEKRDGDWVIVHDHESVPFDPESGQALIDLEP